jgi:hypothetical protein
VQVPLKRQRPDFYFRVDGHLNAAGHSYVANSVLDRLMTELQPQ